MGFCEMIYHETRNFPDTEKDGLAKELRISAMLLLRQITRESVKTQKDFLNALDSTIEIQLDILLLLKLAFRMGFIDQGVYQTMEEDLKGLESITNEMKGMHGIAVASDSIFTHAKPEKKPDKKPAKRPNVSSDKTKPKEKAKEDKPARQSSNRSRRGRSSKAKPEKPQTSKPKKQKLESVIKPEESDATTSIALENFEGTPLYEDGNDIAPKIENEMIVSDELKSGAESDNIESDTPDEKSAPKKKSGRRPARSRWSLKRSSSKKPPTKSQSNDK